MTADQILQIALENKQAMDEAMRNAFGSHRAKRQFAEVPADPSAWGHLTERSGECVQAPNHDNRALRPERATEEEPK